MLNWREAASVGVRRKMVEEPSDQLNASVAKKIPGAGPETKGLMSRSRPNPAGAESGTGLGRRICQVWAWDESVAATNAAATVRWSRNRVIMVLVVFVSSRPVLNLAMTIPRGSGLQFYRNGRGFDWDNGVASEPKASARRK